MEKLAFCAMVTKVSWIASWVLMRSLPWAQRKRWILVRLMGCVHIHRGMSAIEGWGGPSHVQNVVQKIGEDNWKARKISRIVNQTLALRLKHDKIWAWWSLDVPLENILGKVQWCICSKMEFWSWTICCSMSCSNGGRHAWVGGDRITCRLEVLLEKKCVIFDSW
jgi:hypothetical protein